MKELLNLKWYRNRNKVACMICRILMGAHAGNGPYSRWCPCRYGLDHCCADLPVPCDGIDAAPGSAKTDIEICLRCQIGAGSGRQERRSLRYGGRIEG